MLKVGATVPDATVWGDFGAAPVALRDALAPRDRSFLCFTPFDWSPT